MTTQAVKDNMSNAACEICKYFSTAGNERRMKTPLKEIRKRDEICKEVCSMKPVRILCQEELDRAELLELLDECKQTFTLLGTAYDETIIKRMLSKLD